MDSFSGLKVITCGTPKSITDIELNIPLTTKILYNAREIGPYINKHTTSILFIILFLDVFHENLGLILNELSERNNIYAILICDNLLTNLQNVFPISPRLITNEITCRAIRAYESTISQFLRSGLEKNAAIMEEKANDLKQWYTTNIKVESSHISIYPVNTDYENLIDFQQNLMDFCKRNYPNRQITICIIDDHIPQSKTLINGQNITSDSSFLLQQKYGQFVCDRMQEIVPIRIYLVGNETHITNEWTKLLLERELDNGQNNIFEYAERCVFMENEPVKNEIKNNLAAVLGCQWQVTKTKPIRIDDLEKDPNFHAALTYVLDTLEIREKKINMDLCEKYINYRDTSSDHSLKFHLTSEARDGHMDENQSSNNAINTSMQCDYMDDSEMN